MRASRILIALVLLSVLTPAGNSFAQSGCQPTLTRPCKPSDNASRLPPPQLPERLVQDDRSTLQLPRMRLDNNTVMGVGVGSGVFGLESRF